MNFSKLRNKPVIVKSGSNIDNLLIDNPTSTYFLFENGKFIMTKKLLIDRQNIKFIGKTGSKFTHILQNNPNEDGLDVEADKFQMKNISIHVQHEGKVALTVANANNTLVQNCHFYGNPTTFTIYYAGPELTEGEETLNAYNNNELDNNNIFKNNVVYTNWSGDSVSFSLQNKSSFCKNIIRGGKLAVYMCRNSIINNNTIYDSSSEGVFISLPSHNIKFCKNKIFECKNAAIKIKNQEEHGEFDPSTYNIYISKNDIYDTYYNGLEINDCIGAYILNNYIHGADNHGIYFLRCKNIKLSFNVITYFSIGFLIEQSSDIDIIGNASYSVYPYEGTHFIKFINTTNCDIKKNKIKGNISSGALYEGNDETILIVNNFYSKYYSYREEQQVIKYRN